MLRIAHFVGPRSTLLYCHCKMAKAGNCGSYTRLVFVESGLRAIQRKYLQVRNDHSSSPSSFPQGTCPEAIFVFYRGYETMMASIDEKTENEEKWMTKSNIPWLPWRSESWPLWDPFLRSVMIMRWAKDPWAFFLLLFQLCFNFSPKIFECCKMHNCILVANHQPYWQITADSPVICRNLDSPFLSP